MVGATGSPAPPADFEVHSLYAGKTGRSDRLDDIPKERKVEANDTHTDGFRTA